MTPTTVKALIEFLRTLPPNMPVLERRYSDYRPMELSTWCVGRGAQQPADDWWRVVEPSSPFTYGLASDVDPARVVDVLIYEGN
jgi:hypothetical protein